MVDTLIRILPHDLTKYYGGANNPRNVVGPIGLGTLNEALSCEIVEELNGEFELSLTYPVTGRHYNDISLMNVLLVKPNPYTHPQLFRIYSITKPLDGKITVSACHISYDLSGYPVKPFKMTDAHDAMRYIRDNMIISNLFSFSADAQTIDGQKDFELGYPVSARNLLGGSDNSVLSNYGGEYEFDNWLVYWHNKRGTDRGMTIRYGKNLTALDIEEKSDGLYTHIIPYYYQEDEDNKVLISGDKTKIGSATYDFERVYMLDVTSEFDDTPSVKDINSYAQKWCNENSSVSMPETSLKVSFVELSKTTEYSQYGILEQVMLGDTVHVQYAELGVSAALRCIKTTYDALLNRYISIELGAASGDVATTIAGLTSISSSNTASSTGITTSTVVKIVEKEISKSIGGAWGYVTLRDDNGDGRFDELLIMDDETVEKAQKIFKWDSYGLSFSNNGRMGNFEYIITSQGTFNFNGISVDNEKITFSKPILINELDAITTENDILINPNEVRGLRHIETDPYATKKIEFTANGMNVTFGVQSTDSKDFVNEFIFTTDSSGKLTQIKNVSTGFVIDISM